LQHRGVCVVVRGGHFYRPSPSYFEDEPAQQKQFAENLGRDTLRRLDPFCQSALFAVERARQASKIPSESPGELFSRQGVCVGTAFGAQSTRVRYSKRLSQLGPGATNPIDFPDSIDGSAAAHIAIHWGLQGPSLTFVQGTASAAGALRAACRAIASGRADRMVLAVGDIFDPWVRSAVTDGMGTTRTGNDDSSSVAPDAVLALILEGCEVRQLDDADVLVTGFAPGNRVEFGGRNTWFERAVTPPKNLQSDSSGVIQIAGAWLEASAPLGNLIGSWHDTSVEVLHGEVSSEGATRLAFLRKAIPR